MNNTQSLRKRKTYTRGADLPVATAIAPGLVGLGVFVGLLYTSINFVTAMCFGIAAWLAVDHISSMVLWALEELKN